MEHIDINGIAMLFSYTFSFNTHRQIITVVDWLTVFIHRIDRVLIQNGSEQYFIVLSFV